MSPILHRAPAAAKRSGLGLTKLKELVKSGELRSIKIGRARFIPDEEIVRYIQRQIAEQNGDDAGVAAPAPPEAPTAIQS